EGTGESAGKAWSGRKSIACWEAWASSWARASSSTGRGILNGMRNAEVIRQWKILKRIEAGRYTTSADLAGEHGVTERTIRRDIEALQEAGFPLYDERSEGRKIWRLVDGY